MYFFLHISSYRDFKIDSEQPIFMSYDLPTVFSHKRQLYKNKEAQVALKIKNNFGTIPASQFSDDTSKSLYWCIITNMSCVLTYKSLLLSANCKRDKFRIILGEDLILHLKMV